MVALKDIKSQITGLSRYGSGLVGVFVGGTSGIGETTAREFVRHTAKPRVYLLGRSQEAADKLMTEFKSINAESHVEFVKSDVSLLRNVDAACEQIKAKESKVNLLVLSAGFLTMEGRNETEEGLDKKLSVHYYSRMRFTQQLQPLLAKAAKEPADGGKLPLARVISVLGGGLEAPVNLDDFDLKKMYSLKNCATHAQTGNTMAFHALAANPAYDGITFIHSAPGFVPTAGIGREMKGPVGLLVKGFAKVLTPIWSVGIQESGERHLWAGTTDSFGKERVLTINQSSDIKRNSAVATMLKDGTQDKIWEHTEGVFRKVCDEGGKY